MTATETDVDAEVDLGEDVTCTGPSPRTGDTCDRPATLLHIVHCPVKRHTRPICGTCRTTLEHADGASLDSYCIYDGSVLYGRVYEWRPL